MTNVKTISVEEEDAIKEAQDRFLCESETSDTLKSRCSRTTSNLNKIRLVKIYQKSLDKLGNCILLENKRSKTLC